jgi:hypothetical protein
MNRAPCSRAAFAAVLLLASAGKLQAQRPAPAPAPTPAPVTLEKHALAAAKQCDLGLAEAVVRAGDGGRFDVGMRARSAEDDRPLHLASAAAVLVEADAKLAMRLVSFELTQVACTDTEAAKSGARIVMHFAPRLPKSPSNTELDLDKENSTMIREALAALQTIETKDGKAAAIAPQIESLRVQPCPGRAPGIDVLVSVRGALFREHASVFEDALLASAKAKDSALGELTKVKEKIRRDGSGAGYTFCLRR